MKTNKKHGENNDMIPKSTGESVNQAAKPASSLKKTMVTSAVSLALLGAGQIPMQALLGAAESPVQAQTQGRNSDQTALREYFRRDFNYVDAKILAAYWGGNEGDAKVRMGHKLLNLPSQDAMAFIREARGLALERSTVTSQRGAGYVMFPINYSDMGYQYEDVEALSRYWKQSIGETKLLMDTLLVSGKDKNIQAALKSAKR